MGASWVNGSATYRQNEYLYNGKMMQDEMGLGWLDYGARFYDPVLGRWHVMDAHTERYNSWSPYNYCLNSPINLIDYLGLDPVYRDGKYYDDGKVDTWDYVSNWIQKNDGIAATYSFNTTSTNAKITKTEEGNKGNTFFVNGKSYTANSYMTLMGRDDKNNSVGDFSGIYNLTENDILWILGHGSGVIYNLYNGWLESAMFAESLGGKLDYKNKAYDILGIDRNSLIEFNGIVYNANEAGNFLWGMVLEYNGGLLSPNKIAQIGTKIQHQRNDERWEQKAITAGRAFGLQLLSKVENYKQLVLNKRLQFREIGH